jgi:hypothetical protein
MTRSPLSVAEKAFAHDKWKAEVMAEEDRRRAADAAKTARLRELRLAREAAEEGAAPKPAAQPKRRK